MKRLTTDHPDGNFETVLNFVYGKDGAAHIRSDGDRDDVPLHEWAKMQCIARGCDEFSGETLEEIDETICDCAFDFPGCPIFLAYTFACQALHLRDRLKMYEDTGLMPEEIKEAQEAMAPISFGRFRDIMEAERAGQLVLLSESNAPLTLEELREIDGEAVWICDPDGSDGMWVLVDLEYELCRTAKGGVAVFETYSKTWLAYRRKPEEGQRETDPV